MQNNQANQAQFSQQSQSMVPATTQPHQSSAISFDPDEFTPQVVQPDLSEVMNANGSFWGFEDQDRDDMIIPRRAITQKDNAVTGVKSGLFSSTISNETTQFINAVAFSYKKSMIMFPKPFNKDSDPICKSSNGKTPDLQDFPNPPSLVCMRLKQDGRREHVCPKSQFGPNNEAPDCQLYYNFLMCDTDRTESFLVSFHGMAISEVKKFITAISEKSRAFKLPMHSFKFRMSIKLASTANGNSYVPVFEQLVPLADPFAYHGQAASLRSFDVTKDNDKSDANDNGSSNSTGGSSPVNSASSTPSAQSASSTQSTSSASQSILPMNNIPPPTDADAPPVDTTAAPQGTLPMGFASNQFANGTMKGATRNSRRTAR